MEKTQTSRTNCSGFTFESGGFVAMLGIIALGFVVLMLKKSKNQAAHNQ